MRRTESNRFFAILVASAMTLGAVQATQAVVSFDQNITPDVLFGSGVANGGWTVDQNNGVEVGLRAKVRFPTPLNVYNSNGDGTYNHAAGNSAGRPLWSFEWSVNTDYDGSTGLVLNDLTYELRLDTNPTTAETYSTFDPIIVPTADHGIGTNATANGAGDNDNPRTDLQYAALIAANNVAQNSWRMDFFFPAPLGKFFDPNVDGTYDFELAAYDALGDLVAETRISVIIGAGGHVVPEPMTAGLGMMGLAALGLATRRRSHA